MTDTMTLPASLPADIKIATTIAIVGGGMAGASLALLLANRLPRFHIVLIEKNALHAASTEQLSLPSFDARSTALSCSTRDILRSIGVWNALEPSLEPIQSVHVSERHRAPGILMRADTVDQPALGYVVENRHLGQHLLSALRQNPAITCLDETSIERVQFTADAALLSHQERTHPAWTLPVALAVIADGSQSALRKQLGIAVDETPYDQHAIIANVVTENPHAGVAYERFTDTGPIALLPLKTIMGAHRAALVWTLPDAEADTVLAMSDTDFLARIMERFGDRCGKLLAVGARHSYPLALAQAREQVRTRLVLLGNAAHSLHPVAGQGFNLILRDCLALTDTLVQAVNTQRDIGELGVLQHYWDTQHWDQQKTITASDWLPRLFSSRDAPHKALRTAALLGLDFLPGLREWFAREATGV